MIEPAFWAWVAFLASWWSASVWVARATTTAPLARRAAYYTGFTIGFAGMFAPIAWTGWRMSHPAATALLAIELGGFAFAWWARIHLGRLWSGMLTLREGHRIVDSGPYGVVRHPIYTAFITSALAFAALSGSPLRLAGALVLAATMTIKSGEEERWLRAELGAAAYDAYARRVPKLVPFVRP